MKSLNNFFSKFEFSIFAGWFFAIHFFEIIILPTLAGPTQLLSSVPLSARFVDIWLRSGDGAHYMNIAKSGYENANHTLFPLWPILIKSLGTNTITTLVAANIFTLFFLFLFSKLIKIEGYGKLRNNILLLFLIFPTGFMLTSALSEPFYLLLSAAAIILGERKKFFLSSIFAALAGATRPVGIIFVFYFLYKIFENRLKNLRKIWWTVPISVSGFFAYLLFLQVKLGDFSLFYKEQSGWGRSLGFSSLSNLFNEQFGVGSQILGAFKPNPIQWLHLLMVFFFVFLAFLSFKKVSRAVWLYSIGIIILPLASGSAIALSRYLLVAFPLFIPLGEFLEKHKTLFYFYVFFCLLFQSLLIIRFFNFEVAD